MSAAQRSGWAKGRVAERWPLVELEDQVGVLWSGVDQWASACVLLVDGRRLVVEGEFVLEIHDVTTEWGRVMSTATIWKAKKVVGQAALAI